MEPLMQVNNPESSLVCWPTAEAKASQVLQGMEAMEDDVEDEDEISVPKMLGQHQFIYNIYINIKYIYIIIMYICLDSRT